MDLLDDPAAGKVVVVPSLGHSAKGAMVNGSVAIYGPNHELLSRLEVADKIGVYGHQHPHDAIFLPNGDVVVCCWAGPPTPGLGPALGTISYWKRLKQEDEIYA